MPVALIIIGTIMIASAWTDRVPLVVSTVADDMRGFAGFFIAILLIGAMGATKETRPVADAFLVLLFVVLLFSSSAAEQFWNTIGNTVSKLN